MIDLTSPTYIKVLMNRHGITFSKSLGQNFLINDNICEQIAQQSLVDEYTNVIEIGPGIGTLTRKLAIKAKKVVAIELDKTLLNVLRETLAEFDNVKVINKDALEVDFNSLIENEFNGEKTVICSNLPYYITSPMIMKLLSGSSKRSECNIKYSPKFDYITLLLQKEAAVRLCAEVGSREAGAITVAVNYYSNPELLFDVSKNNFIPMPNVQSQVIRLNVLENHLIKVQDENLFFKVVKASFAQRRKTLLNSLSSSLGLPKSIIIEVLDKCNIDKNIRGEKLTMNDYKNITDVLSSKE